MACRMRSCLEYPQPLPSGDTPPLPLPKPLIYAPTPSSLHMAHTPVCSLTASRSGGGLSLLGSRRVMNALGFAGLAISVMALPALSKAPPAYSTICFGAALFSTGLHAEGFRANYLEVTRAHVGIVSAVGNCLSSVASMAAPLLVGNLVQVPFCSCLLCVGVCVFVFVFVLVFCHF